MNGIRAIDLEQAASTIENALVDVGIKIARLDGTMKEILVIMKQQLEDRK